MTLIAEAICSLWAVWGRSIPAMKTIVSSLERASLVVFAWTVEMEPSCPVFIAWSISSASPLLTSPRIILSGLILRVFLTRSLWVTSPFPSIFGGRVSSQTDPFFQADVERISEIKPDVITIEDEAQMRTVKEQLDKAVSLGKTILPDVMGVVEGIEDPGRLADLIASNIGLKTEQAQEILEIIDPIPRLRRVSEILGREIELLTVQQKLQSEARGEIDKTQRDYFLREQLKAIQKELGDIDERA